MKKRILSFSLITAMACSFLGGCGGTNTTTIPEETTADGVQKGEYAYEQELNIIDDNYRNYYEIFVYSFYDSDGDGIGDINGVIEKLDYIEDMGFNGIWFMPIMPSNTYHKYNVHDYYNIDPAYGTLEDFQDLLDECHARDINVIIDLVMNHSSNTHPWFQEAVKYIKSLPEGAEGSEEECKYFGYYNFSTKPVGKSHQIVGTKYYYEGEFVSSMPDLNLANPNVKKEFEDIAKFWIDMGVDGFRMDAVMHFSETDMNFNIETISWFYDYCLSLNRDFYMVSEVWSGQGTIESYYKSSIPSYFNFALADAEGTLVSVGRGGSTATAFAKKMLSCQEDYSGSNPDYIDAPFITNHDMGRVANMLMNDPNKLKMTGGLLLTMSGSPFVYYGEEIGMKSSGSKDENKRLPMVWSKTDTTGMPNGPTAADKGIESAFPGVDEQLNDEYSLLNYYKRALRIRNENPEIARGTIKMVESLCEGHQAAITKTWEGSTIGIVYNTSDEVKVIDITGTDLEKMGIRGYLTVNGEIITLVDGKLTMPAKSICILK